MGSVRKENSEWEVFASAFADASNPLTFGNATESYLVAYPEVKRESANTAGPRLLKEERIRKLIEERMAQNRTAAGLTAAQFIARGWEVFEKLVDLALRDPKAANAVPAMFEKVGKAAGFVIDRSVSKKEVVKRTELPSNEEVDRLQEKLARFKRLNAPNALPGASAKVIPQPAEEQPADFEIVEQRTDESSTEEQ